MKRTRTVIVLTTIVVLFASALFYLWKKNQEDPIKYTSELPSEQTIVVKAVATGSIVPKEEIFVITSYSIHYTKLYEWFIKPPFFIFAIQ